MILVCALCSVLMPSIQVLHKGELAIEDGLFLNRESAIHLKHQLDFREKEYELLLRRQSLECDLEIEGLRIELLDAQEDAQRLRKGKRRSWIATAALGALGAVILGVLTL